MTGSASHEPSPVPNEGENDEAPFGRDAGDKDRGLGGQLQMLRPKPDADIDRACALFPLTDLGNAERFVRRFGNDFRFCAELGWFLWDKRRWELLSEEKDKLPALVMQAVFLTIRAIKNEARLVRASGVRNTDVDDPESADAFAMDHVIDVKKGILYSDKIAEWARSSESAARLNCVALLAKNFTGIAVAVTDFDTDRMAINCQNGTLRILRANKKRAPAEIAAGKSEWHNVWSVKLCEHDRADLITKITQVEYRPKAKSPVYDAFMEKVQPDADMRRFIAQWGGLSLTGDTSEQKLAFFYGQGRNGKGTWVEAVAWIAGDYAGTIGIASLLDNGKKRGDQATPDVAVLPGVRFLRVSEPSVGGVLNEGLVKEWTGGDPVSARLLNKGFFTFFPEFKITISGNNKPTIKDISVGMWERMQLVPWSVIVPKADRDGKLGAKLRAEANGIFARLIEGLLDWSANGLIQPEAVRAATDKYKDDSDGLGRFLRQCCVLGVDSSATRFRVRKTELYELFEAWATQTGAYVLQSRAFTKAMENKGFEFKSSNGDWWLNIRAAFTAQDVKEGRWTAVDDDEAMPQSGIDNSDLDDFLPV
jgi:putative DNA primase/helicase